MREWLGAAALALCVVGPAGADVIAPGDVVFDNGAIETSLTGAPGDPVAGRALMERSGGNCIACHSAEALADLPFHGEVGPMLDGVADRWSEAELRGIVANAKIMFEGTIMPSFYKTTGYIRPGDGFTGKAPQGELPPLLNAQQVEDLVAFLMTLKDQ